MSERYLYSVHPRKPIKNLSDVAVIRAPKSLSLTLEDVLTCLKSAVVYRRFANENRIERVTILNAERLHNAKFMTEEEYEKFLVAKAGDTKNVTVAPAAEVASEEDAKAVETTETATEAEEEKVVVEPEVVATVSTEKEADVEKENSTTDSEVTSEEDAKAVETTETATEAEEEKVVVEPEVVEAPKVEVKAPQNYNKNNNYHNGNKNKK